MAIVAFVTAAGAPGCTTTALGLALTWTGPTILIEADPAGSSISSGYFRGTVDHSRSVLNLALGGGQDNLPAAILSQCQRLDDKAERHILLGLPEATQASAMQAWWDPISEALLQLDEAGYTIIIDAGRLTQGSYPMGLLSVADLVLLVCDATLTSAVRSQPVAVALATNLERQGRGDCLGLAVIGATDYTPGEVAHALSIPLVLSIPDDPKNARVLSDGAIERKFPRSALAREYSSGSVAINRIVGQRRDRVRGRIAERLAERALTNSGRGDY